jgi:hypothetical protein
LAMSEALPLLVVADIAILVLALLVPEMFRR